jgi:hypothetical protein
MNRGRAVDCLGTPVAMRARMRRSRRVAGAVLSLSLVVGCNLDSGPDWQPPPVVPSVAMQDGLDLGLDNAVLAGFGDPLVDDLATPYVVGAGLHISVLAIGYSDTSSWTLLSSDPTVLIVGAATSELVFPLTAVGPGNATLTVMDGDGRGVDQHAVVVDQPDSIQLGSQPVQPMTLVEGGTAEFYVTYFQGSQQLSGTGAVTPTGTGAVTALTATSPPPVVDWVEIEAGQPGTGQVALSVGTTTFVVPVLVVPPSAIAGLGLVVEPGDEDDPDGTLDFVLASALNPQGGRVYGASFSWSIDGVPVSASLPSGEPADSLGYTHDKGVTETVTAAFGSLSSSVTVHGTGGTVGSSVGGEI